MANRPLFVAFDVWPRRKTTAADKPLTNQHKQDVLAGFAELNPYPGVGPAMRTVREAGVHVITLTNGSPSEAVGPMA